MQPALLGRQPRGHRDTAGSHLRSGPAPQQPGRSRRRKGRRGSHAPPKASLFRLFWGRKEKLQIRNLSKSSLKRQGRVRPAARGCGEGGAGVFAPTCRAPGNPAARREAGIGDGRASPGAYK